MAVTLKDIAKRAGLHPSTISRVLSGKYENFNVSEETRELIFKIAREFQYVPNEMARSLRLKKTQTLGLIIPDILNPVFAGLARGVGIACEKKNYSYIVCNTDEVQEKEVKYIEMLRSRGIDGMIIVPVQERIDHLVDLAAEKYPFVLATRSIAELNVDSITTNNRAEVFNAIEYLLKLGHHRIAFIGGHQASLAIQERLQGYRDALAQYRIDFDPELVEGSGHSQESGYLAAKNVLNRPHRPTALFVSSNVIIVGVLEATFEAGLSIPDDISIAGYADMRATPYLSCPLTALVQPVDAIAKQAVRLLLQRIEADEEPEVEKIVLSSKFHIGKSTQKALGS
jgi:DNA-binding LacI/PurR family transcriptional regulator